MNNPKVSIIIPVYNGSNYLREAIDSALNQTYDNCEVIVVNDGSTDNGKTEEIANEYREKVRYFKKDNGGVASALNLGIREMKGDYFSWLSHDDIYYPDKVKREVDAIFKSKNEKTLVQCEYDFFDCKSGEKTPTNFHEIYSNEQITNSVFTVLQLQIHACAALIHKSHFERVGLFDESRKLSQDIEMWFRIFRGQKSIWVNESLYMVRVHDKADSHSKYDEWNKENSKLYVELINKMDDKELSELYGTAENALCRIIGLIKSRDGDSTSLERRFKKVIGAKSFYKKDLARAIYNRFDGKNRKIILFGAGQYGIRMLYELKCRGVKVEGFMDNNPLKNGLTIKGITCRKMDYYKDEAENIILIVTQRLSKEACKQAEIEGYPYVTTRQSLDRLLLEYPPYILEANI